MAANLEGRSLLSLLEFEPAEIEQLLDLALACKRERAGGRRQRRFEGKTLAMIFEKTSTRTRCAFETAFAEEGGHPIFLNKNDIQLGEKETVEDTARVLGRMCDAIEFRGFRHDSVEKLAAFAGVPVYNGLTDLHHPTQALADIMTIREQLGRWKGARLAFVGDGRNNVARSLLIVSAKLGLHFAIVAPRELHLDRETVQTCEALLRASGGTFTMTDDLREGVRGADAVYTDVWASMGEEAKLAERVRLLTPFRVSEELMAATGKPSAFFLHCLPAVRGNEVTAQVIDGPRSRVWDQAENRMHTIKALMLATIPR
jgi:ornithine carbamoyltransferase